MTAIIKAGKNDIELLTGIAKTSFTESHGHSAPADDINAYLNEKYSQAVFVQELNDESNIYHIIYYNGRAAGYSKISMNCAYTGAEAGNITKLERLYLLKDFYDLKLGMELLLYNISLSKSNGQTGMWLYTWKENERAVNFYKKAGFAITGSHDFKISETHSNPNHLMFLRF
ncbi:MAG TPA: GNAT family N-acetyltransferase [Ferruginibacter sp.]|nr:GNAT family N-acetyltransferase [Ferruginibacter sp.]